eukprot:TRINITY_DN42654_c0_g1_i1.p1 TRINITY_DN42654_c0_g1~~TRINITY_DN42654_c0_g1_i1.p1  ORF type:complete len:600 (+),score=198.58 TRINITY_DN42654_c0_g1_i1:51-1802(+)
MQEAVAAVAAELMGPGGDFELGPGHWKLGYDKKERPVNGIMFKRGLNNLREAYDKYYGMNAGKDCVVFKNERLTFGQFWQKACALGAALVETFGIRRGDRVGVCSQNNPEWMLSFVAITAIGAVVVPLNSWWKGHELEYGITDAGCKIFICDLRRYNQVSDILPRLKVTPVLIRAQVPNVLSFNDLIMPFIGCPCPAVYPASYDVAAIMYTSGTTGHPKGVTLTHLGVCTQLTIAAVTTELTTRIQAKFKVPPSPYQECAIVPVPLFHVTASHHLFLSSMIIGRKLVLMEKWDAGLALELIEREKATNWTGVPTMVQDLMEHPDFAKRDTSSLTAVGGGGAPTPLSQVGKVVKKFKTAAPAQGYGLTETNGAVAWIKGDEYVTKPGSTGKPFPTVEVLVCDTETGKVLKQGERGELLVRSPLNYLKYWNKEKATNESLVEVEGHGYGWFRTGDVVEVDAEGYIYIKDRAKDIIIRGGENISCAEVESAFFSTCHDIHELSCFGLKHERLGEQVAILIHPKAGVNPDPAQLIESVRKAAVLADFKIPEVSAIFFTHEPLPRGATGKILKRVIRDEYNKKVQSKL